jgi:hypothetical protein
MGRSVVREHPSLIAVTRIGLELCAGLLVVACDDAERANRSPRAPFAVTSSTRGTYAISGTVRDTSRRPVAAARVDVIAPGFEGRFAVADADGTFEIGDLAGGVQLQAARPGYFADARAIAVTERGPVDFRLQPIERISIGTTIRAALTSDFPVCRAEDSGLIVPERGAMCRRFLLTASVSGQLAIELTCEAGADLGVTLVGPDERLTQSLTRVGRTSVVVHVDQGSTYEVHVVGIRERLYTGQEFELRATLR